MTSQRALSLLTVTLTTCLRSCFSLVKLLFFPRFQCCGLWKEVTMPTEGEGTLYIIKRKKIQNNFEVSVYKHFGKLCFYSLKGRDPCA